MDDETIIACNDLGEVYCLKNGEVLQTISNAFVGFQNIPATTVSTFSKGFLVGSEDGKVAMWYKSEENEASAGVDYYDFIHIYDTGKMFQIVCITIAPQEDYLTILQKNNCISTCPMVSVHMRNENKDKDIKFTTLNNGFHGGSITDLDVAIQRPLLVTISKEDSTLRVWNYCTLQCEMAKKIQINEEKADIDPLARAPQSVAFHPSGYYLAVGFLDKVRLFHLMMTEIRRFRELSIKNVTHMRFARDGHLLACASGHNVYIFTSFTLQQVEIIKQHKSLVTCVQWAPLDLSLATCSLDGSMYDFTVKKWQSKNDIFSKGTEFTSITFWNQNMLGVGINQGKSVVREFSVEKREFYPQTIGPLSQVHSIQTIHGTNILVSGDQSGGIQILSDNGKIKHEVWAHQGTVNKLGSSSDGRYLFSIGQDGILMIWQLSETSDFQGQVQIIEAVEKEGFLRAVDESLANVVLIEKADLEAYRQAKETMQQEVQNMKIKLEYVNNSLEMQFEDRLNKMKEALLSEVQASERRYEELQIQKRNQEREYAQLIKNMETRHLGDIESLENMYERKLQIEAERYMQLEQDKLELKSYYENQLKMLQKQNEDGLNDLLQKFKQNLKKTQEESDKTKKMAEDLKMVYEERLAQQEDEHEAEIMEAQTNAKDTINNLGTQLNQLNWQHENLKKQQNLVKEEKESMNKFIKQKEAEIEAYQNEIAELQAHITSLDKNKQELEETIQKKDNKIFQQKGQIKELIKYKEMLSYQAKQMKTALEPKEHEIITLKQEKFNLNREYEIQMKQKQETAKVITEKDQFVARLKADVAKYQNIIQEKENYINKFMNEINTAVTQHEPRLWAEDLKEMYKKYVRQEVIEKLQKDPDSLDEIERQMRYMEGTLKGLRETQGKIFQRTKLDMRKRTEENTNLIKELNSLREENRLYVQKVKKKKLKIKELKMQINRLQKETTKLPKVQQSQSQKSVSQPQQRQGPPTGGRLYKATSNEVQRGHHLADKQRLLELQAQNEDANQQILYQKMEIRQLREQLVKLLDDRQLEEQQQQQQQPQTQLL